MKPGDLVLLLPNGNLRKEKVMGIIISYRITKWDKNILFYTLLTPSGLIETMKYATEDWVMVNETR